jgi:hypothetical protein
LKEMGHVAALTFTSQQRHRFCGRAGRAVRSRPGGRGCGAGLRPCGSVVATATGAKGGLGWGALDHHEWIALGEDHQRAGLDHA